MRTPWKPKLRVNWVVRSGELMVALDSALPVSPQNYHTRCGNAHNTTQLEFLERDYRMEFKSILSDADLAVNEIPESNSYQFH